MRLALFRRLMQQVRAVYRSDAPLFAFAEGGQPLAPGVYLAIEEDGKLAFARDGDHYRLAGDTAWPETVALIPAPAPPGLYIFQQSDGSRTTFYGALRIATGQPGFALFSPEGDKAAALGAAIANGATPGNFGYTFTDRAALLAALVPLAQEAPASAWNSYRPA